MKKIETFIENEFAKAGIKINGKEDWDIIVHDKKFYKEVLFGGSLGLARAYFINQYWDCKRIDVFIEKILRAGLQNKSTAETLRKITSIFGKKKKYSAEHCIASHYDKGNGLYTRMLDKRMVYSCGYWQNANATTLDEAQENKMELISRKLKLKQGQKILDIGCGWGSFLKYASEKYGIIGVGITLSREQINLGQKLCKGLPIEIRFQDYHDLDPNEKFDHIVSVGMFEHVRPENYATFMQIAHSLLRDGGKFLLHTIMSNTTDNAVDPFIGEYIFPGGILPSLKQIAGSVENLFIVENIHNFGPDYDKTLMAWAKNIKDHKDYVIEAYGEKFFRMWTYYLLVCAGSFRARHIQLFQIVLSKEGVVGGYEPIY